MIAGMIITDSEDEKSSLAFLEDEKTDTYSLESTEDIIELIVSKEPEILAVDAETEVSRKKLTDGEEKLKEEGYSFIPSSNERKKVERVMAIERSINHQMERPPELIRFDPFISSRELALDGDQSLESLGIDTSNIESAREFDAVTGAVTARFYSQNQYNESGVVIPESI